MATIRKPSMPVIKMNTPAVNRLHVIAKLMDELTKELDHVELLEGSIRDKRKYRESTELAGKAKSAVVTVRDSLASKGGSNVAKGYKS